MDFFNLVMKSAGSIVVLFVLTKMLGKKQIGQLNLFDYVIGISIGNVVAEMSINKEVYFWDGVITMAIYTIIAIIITYVTTKSIILRRWIGGTPVTVIENGKILQEGLRKVKFDINDLLEEARINGYFELSEIEYAIMEANGRLSFLPKSKFKPLTPNDMKLKPAYKGLTANVVLDGVIMKKNLKYIKKDKTWLVERLKKMGYENIENLLLVTCNTNEQLTVYEKNIKEEKPGCLE